jgi:peptidoglycan/LPS O-acetylase OafA/YrhL
VIDSRIKKSNDQMELTLPQNIAKEQFLALTGIRALGAAAVFFIHLPFAFGYTLVIDVMAFFFVLSGFLIVYLYYENMPMRAGIFRQYFVNRFARIYPVYFLLVTVAILLRHDFRAVFLIKNYTITHSLFHNLSDRAIQQSWSITAEECFYLLAPLIMYLVRKFSFWVAFLFGTLLLGITLLVSTWPVSFLHSARFVFSNTFFGHFFEFFCGIFLALVILRLKKNQTLFLPGRKYTMIGGIGILLAIGILVISDNMNDPNRATQFILVNNFLLPVPVAFFYYGLIREKSFLSRILSSPLLHMLGRTSYAFYLVHVLVIEYLAKPFIEPLFRCCHNLYVLVVFVLAQLIAFLIFTYYEEPLNLYIRKIFSRKR